MASKKVVVGMSGGVEAFNLDAVLFCIIPKGSMNCFFSKKRTVKVKRKKTINE